MDIEKRKHPRFSLNGLIASITITPPLPTEKITLDGTIIDMSYTGIKIKLSKPIDTVSSGSEIKIDFTLPDSNLPVSIHGVIKHLINDSEYGLQFSDCHPEHKVDDLMFECIKVSADHIQRIIVPLP